MQKKEIKRGDLFYYDFGEKKGSIQSGVRPVLVVQADCYNQNAPTVIVVCLSTAVKKRYLPSHIVIGEDFGLKKPSMILLEQIQTVSKEHLTDYIGNVDDERLWKRINITLKKIFDMWYYKKEEKEDIRCLCPKCLNEYLHNPNYIVRRADPFAKIKEKCDKCGESGWEYILYDRSAPDNQRGGQR